MTNSEAVSGQHVVVQRAGVRARAVRAAPVHEAAVPAVLPGVQGEAPRVALARDEDLIRGRDEDAPGDTFEHCDTCRHFPRVRL